MPNDHLYTNQVWPVMLTPMNADRTIDWAGVDRLTDWYLDAGIRGLFTNCRSSEVEFLTPAERVQLAERVVKRVDGRAAVVATGTYGAPADQEIATIKEMADVGVDAAIILTNHLGAPSASEAEWSGQLERIVDGTGDIELGFYECPTPWKRVLPTTVYGWAAATGRFVFHKDVSHSVPDIAGKLTASKGTRLRLYNGQISSLVESLTLGASGHSGYASTLWPGLAVWLCENGAQDTEQARNVQRILTVSERMINTGYPTSAKQWLNYTSDLGLTPVSRMPGSYQLDGHEFAGLAQMVDLVRSLELDHA